MLRSPDRNGSRRAHTHTHTRTVVFASPAPSLDGLSPLHVAVRLKDDTSIYLLLEYGARIRAKDRAGKMLVDESPALGRPLPPTRAHVVLAHVDTWVCVQTPTGPLQPQCSPTLWRRPSSSCSSRRT